MGQVLHGSATTTEATCRAIQRSEESERALAGRYSISPTTVQKWRKRATVSDHPMGPAESHSTVLSIEHEVMRECPVFCVWLNWSMRPERSKDDDDFQRTSG
jgi:hypothetical protein